MKSQTAARRSAGRRLAATIEQLGLDIRQIARDTGIDLVTLQNLRKFTPQLSTIERVAQYVEGACRRRKDSVSTR